MPEPRAVLAVQGPARSAATNAPNSGLRNRSLLHTAPPNPITEDGGQPVGKNQNSRVKTNCCNGDCSATPTRSGTACSSPSPAATRFLEYLLTAGAEAKAADKAGNTPLSLARGQGAEKVRQLLEAAVGK